MATKPFRVGLIQMRAGRSPQANFEVAAALIREAKAGGADYVQTPEMSNIMESDRARFFAALAPEEDDLMLAGMRELARSCGLFVHLGSLAVRASADKAGELAVLADLPWGRLGLTICYDLRFPALYRALAEAGALFVSIPSAFTKQTGEAHWHVLLRARAIENGCFVFAAAQGGGHENGRNTYGHSLAIDPWGEVLVEAGTEPCVSLADIDPQAVAAARSRIPSLQHGRRFEMLKPVDAPAHLHVVGGAP
jgi:predicted amidohydrolase